jgi:hypothetical protein
MQLVLAAMLKAAAFRRMRRRIMVDEPTAVRRKHVARRIQIYILFQDRRLEFMLWIHVKAISHRLSAILRGLASLSGDRYDPCRYYMRGPGPKTEAARRARGGAGRAETPGFKGRPSIAGK